MTPQVLLGYPFIDHTASPCAGPAAAAQGTRQLHAAQGDTLSFVDVWPAFGNISGDRKPCPARCGRALRHCRGAARRVRRTCNMSKSCHSFLRATARGALFPRCGRGTGRCKKSGSAFAYLRETPRRRWIWHIRQRRARRQNTPCTGFTTGPGPCAITRRGVLYLDTESQQAAFFAAARTLQAIL